MLDIAEKKTLNSHKLTQNYVMVATQILAGNFKLSLMNPSEKNGPSNLDQTSVSVVLF